jgi:hypothetical protein
MDSFGGDVHGAEAMLISIDGALVRDFPYANTHQHVLQELGESADWFLECLRDCIAKAD